MAIAERAAPDASVTRRAFDAVAASYHRTNRDNVLLEAMRRRSLDALSASVLPGAHVLDLGCGPGTDFEDLLDAGYRVTAVESSPAMVREARARAAGLRHKGAVDVRQLPIEDIDALGAGAFDAAYSSLGPLNCVSDLARVAATLATRLKPGGVLIASVIGRLCPWEVALYAWKRDVRRLAVRFSREFVPVPLGAGTIWTRYYSPGEFERVFRRAGFVRVGLRGLGVLVPPPYVHEAAMRRPRLTRFLQSLEDRVGGWPGIRAFGDHFLITLRRH